MSKKTKNDKITVNVNKLILIRERAKIKQIDFKKGGAHYNHGFSYRTYQRAEEGEDISFSSLNEIAAWFDRFFTKNKIDENVSVNDLINQKENKKTKKEIVEIIQQSSFIHRIEEYGQLERVLRFSKNKRQIFYLFEPSVEDNEIIKKAIVEIHDIYKNLTNPTNYQSKNESFSEEDLYLEIEKLERRTNLSEKLSSINKSNIYLYAGNFPFPLVEIFSNDPLYEKNEETVGNWKSIATLKNYAILVFTKSKHSASLTFSYNNFWHSEKIRHMVEKHPFSINAVDAYTAYEKCRAHYNRVAGYSIDFFRKQTNFETTDVYDLLSDEEIDQIGREYMENEADNRLADLNYDMMRDDRED